MFWRHCGGTSCTKRFTLSVTYLATAKICARQVARKVGLNSTFGNGSCNLSRNEFDRCKVCYTVKCFVQLVPPQCRQNIAGQVARDISQCNSAFSVVSTAQWLGRMPGDPGIPQPRPQGAFPWLTQSQGKAPWGRGWGSRYKTRSDDSLNLFLLVPGSTSRLHLQVATLVYLSFTVVVL